MRAKAGNIGEVVAHFPEVYGDLTASYRQLAKIELNSDIVERFEG